MSINRETLEGLVDAYGKAVKRIVTCGFEVVDARRKEADEARAALLEYAQGGGKSESSSNPTPERTDWMERVEAALKHHEDNVEEVGYCGEEAGWAKLDYVIQSREALLSIIRERAAAPQVEAKPFAYINTAESGKWRLHWDKSDAEDDEADFDETAVPLYRLAPVPPTTTPTPDEPKEAL